MSEEPSPSGSRAALDKELAKLQEQMIALGQRVEAALSSALQALQHGDRDIAASIIAEDSELNEMRFAVERIGTEAIATQQPAAKDLRAIVAVMSMVVDLERMGDHAAGIAKTVMQMEAADHRQLPTELTRMGDSVTRMLQEALQAYEAGDPEIAYSVALQDHSIDAHYQALVHELLERMAEQPTNTSELIYLLFAGHNLERIADRITNLSERVIFMVSGRMQELNPEPDEARIS